MSEKSKSGIFQQFLYTLQNKGYLFLAPKPKNIEKFLKKELSETEYGSQLSFFKKVLKTGSKFDLLPVYGHGVRKTNAQLLTLISALVAARKLDITLWQNGVVIPVFNDLSEERIGELKTTFEQLWPKAEGSSVKVELASLNDFEGAKMGGIVGQGHLVVVPVGSVPKKVFDLVFAQATLAPIIEGVNSLNFMGLLGKPFLPSALHEGFHFRDQQIKLDDSQSDRDQFHDFGSITWRAWQELSAANVEQVKFLGEFYRSVARRQFEAQAYFAKFKLDKKEQEQVAESILEFVRITGVHFDPKLIGNNLQDILKCAQQLNNSNRGESEP